MILWIIAAEVAFRAALAIEREACCAMHEVNARIVILGGGFGGVTIVRHLEVCQAMTSRSCS